MTDAYAVIGNPVAHSKSPLIHSEFAKQTGQRLTYRVIHAETADFEATVWRFRDGRGRGLNVTVPFKQRAYAMSTRHSAHAEQAQAVNTLRFDSGEVVGHNTDGIGLVRDLTENLSVAVGGRRVLLMGAGGAAYGVCGPILDERPAALVVVNRTRGKAAGLIAHMKTAYPRGPLTESSYEDLSDSVFDLVVNATSAGLSNALPPLPQAVFGDGSLAYDMMYGRTTPFLELAASAGARTADGLGMLVEQAAESFFIWRGVRPDTAPVIALLRGQQ